MTLLNHLVKSNVQWLQTTVKRMNCTRLKRYLCTDGRHSLVKIGTHSGTFHCDEILACYMLKLLPEYQHATIVRTRDSESLNQCDIVVDVGSVYDHSKRRYDHHQRFVSLSCVYTFFIFQSVQ